MRLKLTIPNQEDISVEQYQAIEKCYKENGESDFSDKFLVKTVFGLSYEAIDSIKQSKLMQIISSLKDVLNQNHAFETTFTMDGVKYGFIPNLQEITSGEYADLEKYIPNHEDYHKVMAVMFRPITNSQGEKYSITKYNGTQDTALTMKKAPFKVLKSALVFFWNLEKELLTASLNFTKKQVMEMGRELEHQPSNSTLKDGGGLQRLYDYLEEITLEYEKQQNSLFLKPSHI